MNDKAIDQNFELRHNPLTPEQYAKLRSWLADDAFLLFIDWLSMYSQEQKIMQWGATNDDNLGDMKKRLTILDILIAQIRLFPQHVDSKVDPKNLVKKVGSVQESET